MLFKKEFIQSILNHEKVQTRRIWKRPMVKIYNYYWAQTSRRKDSRFARFQVLSFNKWDGVYISEEDARKEGFDSAKDFWGAWYGINSNERIDDPTRTHYVIEFNVIPKEDWHLTKNRMFTTSKE